MIAAEMTDLPSLQSTTQFTIQLQSLQLMKINDRKVYHYLKNEGRKPKETIGDLVTTAGTR